MNRVVRGVAKLDAGLVEHPFTQRREHQFTMALFEIDDLQSSDLDRFVGGERDARFDGESVALRHEEQAVLAGVGERRLSGSATRRRLADRPQLAAVFTQKKEASARVGVIVRAPRQVDRRAAARHAFDAHGPLPVLKPLAGHQPVGQFQRPRARHAASRR